MNCNKILHFNIIIIFAKIWFILVSGCDVPKVIRGKISNTKKKQVALGFRITIACENGFALFNIGPKFTSLCLFSGHFDKLDVLVTCCKYGWNKIDF